MAKAMTIANQTHDLGANAHKHDEMTIRLLQQALAVNKTTVWIYNRDTRTISKSHYAGHIDGLLDSISNMPEPLIAAGYVDEGSIEEIRRCYDRLDTTTTTVVLDVLMKKLGNLTNSWQRSIFTPFPEPDGSIHNFLVTSTDITEQKLEEDQERQLLEAINNRIASDIYDFVMIFDGVNKTGRLISQNNPVLGQIAHSLFKDGIEKGIELFCQTCVPLASRRDTLKRLCLPNIAKELEANGGFRTTVNTIGPDHTLEIKRFSYSYLNREKHLVLLTTEDITELMQSQHRENIILNEALEKAEKASAAKSAFLSNMSHDMRTPMNAIIGFSEMALSQATSKEKLLDYMKKINTSGQYLLTLINDVLDMNKMESHKLALKLEPINTKELFDSILNTIRPLMEAKKIHFNFQLLNCTDPRPVLLDSLRVQQIYMNLLSNAVRFTPPGGRIDLIVEVLEYEGDIVKAHALVRDNGCGMSPEFVKRAFEPFEQEDNRENRESSGTGLGLSIVKQLMDLFGGQVLLRSTQGKGTEFELIFSLKLVEEQPTKALETGSNEAEALKGKHILLCEDHPLNIEISTALLRRKGMRVEVAHNGQEGVDLFLQRPAGYYDAILMDVKMPVLNGLEATEKIRRAIKTDARLIPIIAMTANAYQEDVDSCLAAGMNDHVPKPVKPKLLYDALVRHICPRQKA